MALTNGFRRSAQYLGRPIVKRSVPAIASSHSFAVKLQNQKNFSDNLHPSVRHFSKMKAPEMVYISGEEMTHYCCNLMMEKWVHPDIDTSK